MVRHSPTKKKKKKNAAPPLLGGQRVIRGGESGGEYQGVGVKGGRSRLHKETSGFMNRQ